MRMAVTLNFDCSYFATENALSFTTLTDRVNHDNQSYISTRRNSQAIKLKNMRYKPSHFI